MIGENSNRERVGKRSPDRDRHRDLEDRNRRSAEHRDREILEIESLVERRKKTEAREARGDRQGRQ